MPDSIGDELRAARDARGLTLAEASDATKIRVRYLRALEAEDWDDLPAPAYARGFLRTYAAYLGLDADAVVEEFRRARPEPAAEPGPVPERQPASVPGDGGFPSWRTLAAIGAVVAVLVILFVLGQGGSGGGGKGGRHANASHHHSHHHRGHTKPAPKPAPAPKHASIELHPTGTVWVCLVDQTGKPLVNGEILTTGDTRGPFKAAAFDLGLGNGEIDITADGRTVAIPSSPSPLAYRVTPTGTTTLSPAKRPTCA